MPTRTRLSFRFPYLASACLILALILHLAPGGSLVPLTGGGDHTSLAHGIGAGNQAVLPSLDQFIKQVTNGNKKQIRGVYVPTIFALRVVQQPANNSGFVSKSRGEATLFGSAAYFGVTGLLVHNYLSGDLFNGLQPGQKVIIIMGDGALRAYRVEQIRTYQRMKKAGQKERFVDLRDQKDYSTVEIFKRFYQGKHHLTFQTCLAHGSDLDWGLLFVVAYPID